MKSLLSFFSRFPSEKSESGYTFIEVVFAIAIFTIGTGATVYGGIRLWRHVESMRRQAAISAELLQIEQAFRKHVSLIRAPYWRQQPEIQRQNGGFAISHYNGDTSSQLSVQIEQMRLEFSYGELSAVFSLPGSARLSVIQNAEGTSRGLRILLRLGTEEIRIEEMFGSSPL